MYKYKQIHDKIVQRGLRENWTRQEIEDEVTLAFRRYEKRRRIAEEVEKAEVYAPGYEDGYGYNKDLNLNDVD